MLRFGIYLVREGVISADDFIKVVDHRLNSRPQIGELAIQLRKLTIHQVFEILKAQVDRVEPFGEMAIRLGFLTTADVYELLAKQNEAAPPLVETLVECDVLDAKTAFEHFKQYRYSLHSQFQANDNDSDQFEDVHHSRVSEVVN